MLQKLNFEDEGDSFGTDVHQEARDQSHLFRPAFYWELIKRRAFYFVIPFVLVLSAGLAVAKLLPATYSSEGKILVQSQQIPTELVRATVTSAAQERIQVIEQRTMTRENLLEIIDKFQLFSGQARLDVRHRTGGIDEERAPGSSRWRNLWHSHNCVRVRKIRPSSLRSASSTQTRRRRPRWQMNWSPEFSMKTFAIVPAAPPTPQNFWPVKSRSFRRMVRHRCKDCPGQADASQAHCLEFAGSARDPIGATKIGVGSEKCTLFGSASGHAVLEAADRGDGESRCAGCASGSSEGQVVPLDVLLAQQESIQKNLEVASTKLAAARLGETLEKDQQSEKLEVIEHPTAPRDPIKPNRPKIAGIALFLAFAAGGGLAFLVELADKSIRRSSDMFNVVDSRLIVSHPLYQTEAELRRRKQRASDFVAASRLVGFVAAIIAVYFFMPPLDLDNRQGPRRTFQVVQIVGESCVDSIRQAVELAKGRESFRR